MIFRVLKEFEAVVFNRRQRFFPGELVDIETKGSAERYKNNGFIGDRSLSHSPQIRMTTPAEPLKQTKRFAIICDTSNFYSGGRIHLYQYGAALIRNGAEVFYVSNRKPIWENDYDEKFQFIPIHQECLPPDIDVIISDGKGTPPTALITKYLNQNTYCKLSILNFETGNFVEAYIPEEAKKRDEANLKFNLERADVILNNSEETKKYLEEYISCKGKYVGVLRPAINEKAISLNVVSTFKPSRPYVVWSARGSKYKCGEAVYKAITSLDKTLDCVFIGYGPTFASTPDHKFINARGITDAEKYALIKGAVCVVAPSLFEGFGYVPGEALASGTPCIVYDLPVLREVYNVSGVQFVKSGDEHGLAKRLADVVADPVSFRPDEATVKNITEYLSIDRMAKECESFPFHAMKRKSVTAHCIAYWGFCPESIESVYPYCDEILIAYGRVGNALEIDDGSLERIKALPDPDGKIRLEIRDDWRDKKEMRNWLCSQTHGNYVLIVDGDEIYTGLDKLLESDLAFGCPRWVHFWHDGEHEITNPPEWGFERWGKRLDGVGSVGTHYRFSWWRPSYRFAKHPKPVDVSGNSIYTIEANKEVCSKVPECVIWHLGQALPKEVMDRKHSFYETRDHAPATRRSAWAKWNGEEKTLDGIVKKIDNVPDIVKRAFEGMQNWKVK